MRQVLTPRRSPADHHDFALGARPKLAHVEIVVNERAGGVGAGAAEAAQQIATDCGVQARAVAASPQDLRRCLTEAIAASPDLLVVLAGDGTARLACTLCGPDGPLVAPLPGGTMNLLPRALYGERDWRTALADILTEGVVKSVGGGEIDGRSFYVAAILGNPALWAPAREALRNRHLLEAFDRALFALRRAFGSKLRFALDEGSTGRAEAMAVLCPLVSRAMSEETALEVAILNPKDLSQALRLGLLALIGGAAGDWREDPSVCVGRCLTARASSRGRIPAILDGEPVRLHKHVDIRFKLIAFYTLAPTADVNQSSPAALRATS